MVTMPDEHRYKKQWFATTRHHHHMHQVEVTAAKENVNYAKGLCTELIKNKDTETHQRLTRHEREDRVHDIHYRLRKLERYLDTLEKRADRMDEYVQETKEWPAKHTATEAILMAISPPLKRNTQYEPPVKLPRMWEHPANTLDYIQKNDNTTIWSYPQHRNHKVVRVTIEYTEEEEF